MVDKKGRKVSVITPAITGYNVSPSLVCCEDPHTEKEGQHEDHNAN